MVGPYAVSELRVSRALQDRGTPPGTAARVYLTDTLESPHAEPPQLPLFMRPISEQRVKALAVKREAPVLVCLGNPPYDRHEAARSRQRGAHRRMGAGGGDGGKGTDAILRDFLDPVAAAGHGVSRQEPLQPLRLLLAVGVVEGVRAGRGGGKRCSELHHRVELARRRCVPGDARAPAAGCATRSGSSIWAVRGGGRAGARTCSPSRRRWRSRPHGERRRRTGRGPPTYAMPASKARARRSSPPSTPSGDLRAWHGGSARTAGRRRSVRRARGSTSPGRC